MGKLLKSYKFKQTAKAIISLMCFVMCYTSINAGVAIWLVAIIFVCAIITGASAIFTAKPVSSKRYRCNVHIYPTQGHSIYMMRHQADYPLWYVAVGPQIQTTSEIKKMVEVLTNPKNLEESKKSMTWELKTQKGWYVFKMNDEKIISFPDIVLKEQQMMRFLKAFLKCEAYHNRYKPEWVLWQLERVTSERILGLNVLYRLIYDPISYDEKRHSPTLSRTLNRLKNRE